MNFEHSPSFVYLLIPMLALVTLIAVRSVFRRFKTRLNGLKLLTAMLAVSPLHALALDAVVQTRLDAQLRCHLGA